jgi:CheY-like chemotaxis protein
MTKILLVEDDKSLREIYGVRLLAEGYDIVSAGDGEEALAMAIKERPQLIVSDVMMPKISGFDMLDILRSTTETKDIKVIMMTALSSEDQRARGEALGADRYLVKSQVGIEDVVRTVHDVLADAPTTTSGNQFTTPRPATPTIPARPAAVPIATPQPTAPTTAPISPRPIAQPTTQANTGPSLYQRPTPVDAPRNLPQPTAPFSTARPANLGERVIHPITPQNNTKPDLSSLMAQELNQGAPEPVIVTTPTPPVPAPPQPMTVTPPAPLPATQAPTPQPVAPSIPLPPAPQVEDSGIAFEETPRPAGAGPQPNPFDDQPPANQ